MDSTESIFYFPSINNTIDIVYHKKVKTSYPLHTHAEHYTVGIMIDGEIEVDTESAKYICKADDIFAISVDMPHAIKTLNGDFYTMISICVHQDYLADCAIDNIRIVIERKLNQILFKNELVKKYSKLLSDGLILLSTNVLKRLFE